MDSVTKGKEQVEAINQAFIAVDEEGASRLEETQDELKTMQTFLSDMSTKFVDSASISNYSVASIRDMTSIKTIRESVYSENRTVSAMYGDKLEAMSIKEIEKGKNEILNQLDKAGQIKLNQAFIDLEKGRINRTEYANILQGELATNIERGHLSDEARASLREYLDEKKGEIGVDFAKDAGIAGMEQTGLALLRKSIEKSDDAVIIKGPKGPTQWAIVDKDKVDKAGKYNKAGQALKSAGKGGGPILSAIGLGYDYKSDIKDGKTPGQAVARTGGSFLAGAGASGSIIAGITFFSGPVGWVGAGVAVVAGVTFSRAFNYAYDNSESFRAGVDWTGKKIDDGLAWTTDKIKEGAHSVSDKVTHSSVYKKLTSEVNSIKQKAGKAVKQVIDERVNQEKKKLNELKKGVGQALKDKISGLKKTKDKLGRELIMDCRVEFLTKNQRYRIVYMDCEYYILDMEKSFWLIFLPILIWLIPQKIYKIDVEIVKQLKTSIKRSGSQVGIVMIGAGSASILAQMVKPILDQTIESSLLVNWT